MDIEALACEQTEAGARLPVKACPGARENEIGGVHDGALRVRVTAAPDKGKANQAIIALLAKALGARPSSLEILSGRSSLRKTVLVRGMACETVLKKLGQIGRAHV